MKMVRSSKMEFAESMKQRTKQFAIDIIKMYKEMPVSDDARILGRQLVKAATSVASNYRAVCRARSDREFFAKLSIVVEEADESIFWMELIEESGIHEIDKGLLIEANEILAIMARSRKTMLNNDSK